MNPLQAHLILLLHELAHGPDFGADHTGGTEGQFSESGSGLLPTLQSLDAVQASLPVAAGRPPVAAAAAHLAQHLTFAGGQLGGAVEFPDFSAPWRIQVVGEEEWRALKEEVRTAFATLVSVLQRRDLEPEELSLALTALTHAATHTGAVRVQAILLQGRL